MFDPFAAEGYMLGIELDRPAAEIRAIGLSMVFCLTSLGNSYSSLATIDYH